MIHLLMRCTYSGGTPESTHSHTSNTPSVSRNQIPFLILLFWEFHLIRLLLIVLVRLPSFTNPSSYTISIPPHPVWIILMSIFMLEQLRESMLIFGIMKTGARFGPRAIRAASSRQTSFRAFNPRAGINPYLSWAKLLDCGDIPVGL